MQGRLLLFQDHPGEGPRNECGSGGLRCNFDVQDMHRVLPEHLWNREAVPLPRLRIDEKREKEMGFMSLWERDGEKFVEREPGRTHGDLRGPVQWRDDKTRSEWRQAFLEAFGQDELDDG